MFWLRRNEAATHAFVGCRKSVATKSSDNILQQTILCCQLPNNRMSRLQQKAPIWCYLVVKFFVFNIKTYHRYIGKWSISMIGLLQDKSGMQIPRRWPKSLRRLIFFFWEIFCFCHFYLPFLIFPLTNVKKLHIMGSYKKYFLWPTTKVVGLSFIWAFSLQNHLFFVIVWSAHTQ